MSGHALSKVTVALPGPVPPDTTAVDQDWRFAELTAQCYLDPALSVRYSVEPRCVLAEFGIVVDETTEIPALPADRGNEVTITSLDPGSTLGRATDCHTWTFGTPERESTSQGLRPETPPA